MDRISLGTLRPVIANVMGVCSTDSRIPTLVNEAERRLVAKGRWVGTVQRYRICVTTNGTIVWPRPIETIESWALCNLPGVVRNEWYEMSPNGPGIVDDQKWTGRNLIDRGTTPTFDQPSTDGSSILGVVSDTTEAAGLYLLVRGYKLVNGSPYFVRTEWPVGSGTYIDGENIEIGAAIHYSTTHFTNITSVIKPATEGNITVREITAATLATVKTLAFYEPDETMPLYRSSLVPGLACQSGCGDASTCCDTDENQVEVQAKLRHIDVVNDNDLLLLGNIGAIKLMVMAILKENRNLPDEAMLYEAKAIKELQDELNSYTGDGVVPTIRYESSETWGAAVLNPLTLGYRIY